MRLKWPSPKLTIYGQITVTIVLCLIVVIVASARLERWVQQDYDVANLEALSNRISTMASVLAVASPSEREAIIEVANRANWDLSVTPIALANRFTNSSPKGSYIEWITDWLSPPDSGPEPYGGWKTFLDGRRVVSAKIGETGLLLLERLPETFVRSDALAFGSNYLVALVTLIVTLSVFAIWTITRPLRRIAAVAMRADISSGPTLFPERGSVEIVALARALNGMQNRISGMIQARTTMLRGISHDLRTPLTRLRLRADRVGENDVKDALLADIERIDRLLGESLNYLRDSQQVEEPERVDLASVIKTICDEFHDTGHDMTYRGPDRFILKVRPLALTRAITNLCENGTKFGTQVEVSMSVAGDFVTIDVADNGPGIPEQHRHRVTEPFYKVDTARGGADPGFGLGLSIVAEIVQAHQGRLELLDRQPTGLLARIKLPIQRK
ncbi:two-component sensor histidine kinase (plasmid) [Rhizobium sp. ACO-34A]|nr:ATP-binding protein [Rhizobium sp. ACO-34A]ATN37851.1 two-component sensor histidine kinase [Rhizobium sp. ACO-34A]